MGEAIAERAPIVLVKQKEPYTGEGYGEYVLAHYQIAKPPQPYMDAAHPLPLSFWSYRPSKAMLDMGIDLTAVKTLTRQPMVMEDPFSGWKALHFVPTLILSRDIDAYNFDGTAHFREMALDKDWMRNQTYREYFEDGKLRPGNGERGMMGSGYTNGTLPCDGHPGLRHCYIDLSNGDTLLGFQWVWYNK